MTVPGRGGRDRFYGRRFVATNHPRLGQLCALERKDNGHWLQLEVLVVVTVIVSNHFAGPLLRNARILLGDSGKPFFTLQRPGNRAQELKSYLSCSTLHQANYLNPMFASRANKFHRHN